MLLMSTQGFARFGFSLCILLLAFTPASHGRRLDWTAQFQEDGNATEWLKLLADAAGNTYVAGTIIGAESREHIAVVKYDANGNQLWSTRAHSADTGDDYVVAAALGPGGHLYVLSLLWNPFEHAALSKFDANGTRVWVRTQAAFFPNGLAIDANENVFVAGIQLNADRTAAGGRLMKYTSGGNEAWSRVMNEPDTGMLIGLATQPDGEGGAYLAGTGFVVGRFNTNGDLVWHRNYSGRHVTSLLTDSDRNLYAVGTDMNDQALIVKLNPAGNQQWQTTHGVLPLDLGYTDPVAAVIDANGNLHIASRCSGELYDVAKLDASGRVRWNSQVVARQDFLFKVGLDVDSRGSVALFYTEAVEVFRDYAAVVVRYNQNGQGKELARFGGFELASDLRFTPRGGIVFTRYSQNESGFSSWITASLNGR